MSEMDLNQTPLSVEPLPVEPLPIEPLPVERILEPVTYEDVRVRSGRPGIISFIGITSIVIGSLAILAGLGFGLMDVGLMMSSFAMNSAAVNVAMTPATVTPARVSSGTVTLAPGQPPERLGSNALPAADRQTVSDGLSRLTTLSPLQLSQLDELLAEEGKNIAPTASGSTPEQFTAMVSKSGHLTMSNGTACDYFTLGLGRLEISDDRAVFFPTGGQPSLRAKAFEIPNAPANPGGLQPDQIRSAVRTINDLNGTKIKSVQLTSLISTLKNPGQKIIVPTTDGSDPAWQISSATTDLTGSLSITTSQNGNVSAISIDSTGNVAQSAVSTANPFANAPKVDTKAATATMICTGLQLLIAIYLLIIGILTLRFSPRGPTLHWIYVIVKLPLAAATAITSAWMWNSFMQSLPNPNNANPVGATQIASLSMGVTPVIIGVVYAIVLLFMLLSKTVRNYYGQLKHPESSSFS